MKIKPFIAVVVSFVVTGCAIAPVELSKDERVLMVTEVLDVMYEDQEQVTQEITLSEAFARALKYNLDHRIALMEKAVSIHQLDLSYYELLPRITASAGYTDRNKVNATSSTDIVTGGQSLTPSTSQDNERTTSELELTWNILDFGVSYYQAKQQADKVLVTKEQKRKAVHNLFQQVRQAYWKAVGAQVLQHKITALLASVETAVSDSHKLEKERLTPPLSALRYQKTLLEMVTQLESVRDQLAMAKPQLSALMNLPPSTNYQLHVPSDFDIPELKFDLKTMEMMALTNRPELVKAKYEERISLLETKKAMARMLPGLQLNLSGNYDSNSYTVNNSWIDGGARITWNLLSLLSGPVTLKVAESRVELAKLQRLALNMAVLTQVHIANQDYNSSRRQYIRAKKLGEIDNRIYVLVKESVASQAKSKLEEIRSESAAMMAELRKFQNYADLQNAYGKILATLGINMLPETIDSHSIETLAAAITERSL